MKISRYLAFAAIGVLSFSSCKKNDQKAEQTELDQQDGPVITTASDNWEAIPNQYIVTYRDNMASTAGTSAQRAAYQTNAVQSILERSQIPDEKVLRKFSEGFNGFTAVLNQSEADKLRQDPSVENIEPDRIIHLSNNLLRPVSQSTQVMPWGVKKTGYADGTGKTCWIIDTGIDFTHPDLHVDVARSKSFLSNDKSAADQNGHGTHVAGTIGARNNNFGVIGVAPNATLISLRALDANGSGVLSSVIAAVNWVGTYGKPGDVVNMSVGGDQSATLDKAVYNASMKGIYFAIAAGNDSKNAANSSPSDVNSPFVFTVSAMNSNDNFASFSNFGNPPIDFCAPGVGILSTYLGGNYGTLSGTSMATPHVAGLLLLEGKNIKSSGPVKNDPDGKADPMAHL
ncbi:MAG: S8 family peptidase [Cytophagaceae bacterium]